MMRRLYLLFFATLLLAIPLCAQTASLAGTVRDATGAVIPAVTVQVVQEGTGLARQAATDSTGFYLLPALPVGSYTVTVEAAGFRKYVRTGVTLSVEQRATLDMTLEVGQVTETVEVAGEAPLLNTRTAEVTVQIDPVRMTELPLNGRNPIQLAGLLPGVDGVQTPEYVLNTNSGPLLSVAGSRLNHNAMLYDGSNHSFAFRNVPGMYPSPDTLREFKIITNLFSAEYGTSGGGVLNAVTRSGSNEFHGNFYEFLRNDNLNARNFFLPRKTSLIQNQFGLTSGGPVVKNRLFFFGSMEWLKVRPEASTVTAFPPTAAERRGDFSASPRTIIDPTTGQAFPNKQIPVSRFDPVAAAVLDRYLPLPNQPDNRYIFSGATQVNAYQLILKLDFQLNSSNTFSNRFYRSDTTQHSPIGPSNIPNYSPGEQGVEYSANNVLSWTSVVSQNKVNELRFSFFFTNDGTLNFNRTTLADLGGRFPNIANHPLIPSRFDVSGRFNLQPQTESGKREEQWEIHENFSWQKTNHSLKIGGRWHHGFYSNRTYDPAKAGRFVFDRSITGESLSDFFLGRPQLMHIISPNYSRDAPGQQFGFYFQDDWRITPTLTLNLGLRYELQIPWIEERGFWSTLYKYSGFQSQRFPAAPVDMAFYGDPGVPDGMIQTDKNNFQPRFGFAWTPSRLSKTVLRGGFGVFGELNNLDIIQNTGQPFQFNQQFFGVQQLSDPLRDLGELPLETNVQNPNFRGPFSLYYPNPDYRSGYIFHYNFVIQREFFNNLSVEVGYVGKQSRKLSRTIDANPAVFIPGQSTATNIEQRRVFRPGLYSTLTESSTTANSNYNSLQVQVIRRLSRGFTVQGAYTLAKSIDDHSNEVLGGPLPNPFDWRSQRGPSNFDHLHRGNISFVFDLPKVGTTPLHKIVLHDWELSGIFTARSGDPFSILSGRDIALSGSPNQTANVVGNPKREHSSKGDAIAQWFNTSAFAFPATGQFGNSARNNVRGPGSWNADIGVYRNIPFAERFRLQFRSEFFNVFNHANLGNPANNLNAPASFGRILSGASPRVIQFALKLYY